MSTPRNQSVIKAFRMLKSFTRADEWLTSSELSRRARLPEASGYRLIQTLEELGAVVRGPRGRYRPSMLLVSLSRNVDLADVLHEAAQKITVGVARQLDVTMHIGLLEEGMVTYVTKVSTRTSYNSHTKPGSQLEAYCSGLGKVLLASLPEDELEDFLAEGDLIPLTKRTIIDPDALREHLKDVRRLGYAMDDREICDDMSCIAVPIHDAHGSTIAALSATESADRMVSERISVLRMALADAARAIGRKVFPSDLPVRQISPSPQSMPRGVVSGIHGVV